MALNVMKRIGILKPHCLLNKTVPKHYSLYEPDYLQTGKPKIPLYPMINIQIKGYDYPILEKYQSVICKIVKHLDIDVDDSWAMPPQKLNVQKFKSNSIVTDAEYKLNMYERNIQVSDMPAAHCALLIRIIETALPEGVALNVSIYDPEYENKRYVPDKMLLDLQSELNHLLQNRGK